MVLYRVDGVTGGAGGVTCDCWARYNIAPDLHSGVKYALAEEPHLEAFQCFRVEAEWLIRGCP